ncbi:hypothetical protein AC579_4088 [Pseudocercospora musae]|uniref:FAD/NAD(P)-binding domain-containing protein n=1 Tax=Pseudocercospora musae TaxID=113226 RepID=A0A139IJD7_9PEZI|nr:hypothetical protein AC579_4088 [Pseudocercospora musae]
MSLTPPKSLIWLRVVTSMVLLRASDNASATLEGVKERKDLTIDGLMDMHMAKFEANKNELFWGLGKFALNAHVLAATGRISNTGGTGLARAGLQVEKGYIVVDEFNRASKDGAVFAAGDCAGSPYFTHVGFDDFRVVRDVLARHTIACHRRSGRQALVALDSDLVLEFLQSGHTPANYYLCTCAAAGDEGAGGLFASAVKLVEARAHASIINANASRRVASYHHHHPESAKTRIMVSGSDTEEERCQDRFPDTAKIKGILRHATSTWRISGHFASVGVVKNATDPRLSRSAPGNESQRAISTMKLPLCEEDANRLFPKRRDTIVGQGPNPWCTNAENVEIGNENFTHSVNGLLPDLKTALGIPEHVQLAARLKHLALFERGHVSIDDLQMTNEESKARLLIVMPSDRIGGVFSLSIGEEQKVLKAEPSAMSYACWYPDARLSISILQSGHILGLLYDVIEPEADYAEGNEQAALNAGLELWTSTSTAPFTLLHVLDHEYTTQSLVFGQLKGSDLSAAQAFVRPSQALEFAIFLASMERKVKRGDHETGYEVYEKELKLRSVHDLEGDLLATDVVVSPEQIIQRGVYKDREPDESDEQWEDGTYYDDYYKDHVRFTLGPGADQI